MSLTGGFNDAQFGCIGNRMQDVEGRWIPAFAGMTKGCWLRAMQPAAAIARHAAASHASLPRTRASMAVAWTDGTSMDPRVRGDDEL